jgi:hypothetical protein
MDFSKHRCPEAEAILADRVTINENMTEPYILEVAKATRWQIHDAGVNLPASLATWP